MSADLCVKCAQCLPHCPTWRLTRDETRSPRGRLALMQALGEGVIEPTEDVVDALDSCLGCRRCEAICPADVPYGRLADEAQAALGAARAPVSWKLRLLRRVLGYPLLWRLFSPVRSGTWGHEDAPRGTVYLFLGCVSRFTDVRTLREARKALVRAGYRVVIPARQTCCGALHLHAGEPDVAAEFAAHNAEACAGDAPIVTCASGCAATLREHPTLGERVVDVSTLLARTESSRQTTAKTVLHTPCTLASVQRQADGPAKLLPGARMLTSTGRCCGGAGEYMLKHPDIAQRLRDEVLDELDDAQVLCTSNPGCAIHLRAGIRARGMDVEVVHPVVEWRRDEPD